MTRGAYDVFRPGYDIEFNFNEPKPEDGPSSSDDDNIFILPAVTILPQVRGNDSGVINEARRSPEVHVLTSTLRFQVSSKCPYAVRALCFQSAHPSDVSFT